MKKLFFVNVSLMVVFISMFTVNAHALVYNIYTNFSDFSLAAGTTSVYDFEPDSVGGNYKIHDFGDFSVNGSDMYLVNIENEATHELHFNSSSYTQDLSLTFHQPIRAFGFDWRNIDNNTDMVRVIFNDILYVLGAKDESGFWGVVASDGEITSDMAFRFGDTSGGAGWTAGNLDNIRYSVGTNPMVPEPTTLLLFGFGLLGFAGITRKTD